MSRNMTIPSRPAPPPPQRNAAPPSRYTPTTDWDFCAFETGCDAVSNQPLTKNGQRIPQRQNVKAKKPPPPRPPPPKLPAAPTAPLKKPGQPQSINILSNLFGQKRSSTGATASGCKSNSGVFSSAKPMVKSHAGAAIQTINSSSSCYGSLTSTASTAAVGTGELISFDSPPSSPTFTQKSCSDCISVDSFSSDSNYSSPNNGNMSQTESGFEDDFVASHREGASVPVMKPPFDPFDAGSTSSSRSAPSAPPPLIYGQLPLALSSTAQIRAPLINSKLQQADFIDPLCNGRSVLPKVPTVSIPTIIKPSGSCSGSQKSTPSHSASTLTTMSNYSATQSSTYKLHGAAVTDCVQFGKDDNYSPSEGETFLPMPSIPPPPPPSFETYSEEPYGIAMYDFMGETMEDLNFKTNEKIYLLKQLNEEWYMGRDRRGLEGMFPVNYIDVKVPISRVTKEQQQKSGRSFSNSTNTLADTLKVRAVYQFTAETAEDLTIKEHEIVTVLYQINSEWLYGEVNGKKGQFPANYIEHVPPNLPKMPSSAAAKSY